MWVVPGKWKLWYSIQFTTWRFSVPPTCTHIGTYMRKRIYGMKMWRSVTSQIAFLQNGNNTSVHMYRHHFMMILPPTLAHTMHFFAKPYRSFTHVHTTSTCREQESQDIAPTSLSLQVCLSPVLTQTKNQKLHMRHSTWFSVIYLHYYTFRTCSVYSTFFYFSSFWKKLKAKSNVKRSKQISFQMKACIQALNMTGLSKYIRDRNLSKNEKMKPAAIKM